MKFVRTSRKDYKIELEILGKDFLELEKLLGRKLWRGL